MFAGSDTPQFPSGAGVRVREAVESTSISCAAKECYGWNAKLRLVSRAFRAEGRMDKFDRIFQLHKILASRRTGISLEELEARLECKRSTVFRALATLKDHLHAPVVFDSTSGGYKYADEARENLYQLPGLWFTPAELQALVVLQRLLADAAGGILEAHLGPISKRLDRLIEHQKLNLGEADRRLRFPALAARSAGSSFHIVASATLQRRKLWMEYHARAQDRRTERMVSPQRLTHYREGWYLDAWDDTRGALRTFSVDRSIRPTVLNDTAIDIPEEQIHEHYANAYCMFGGKAHKIRLLRVTPERARGRGDEGRHPDHQGEYRADGRCGLRLPSKGPRVFVMVIFRHGPEV